MASVQHQAPSAVLLWKETLLTKISLDVEMNAAVRTHRIWSTANHL